jgi:hypothetical protein
VSQPRGEQSTNGSWMREWGGQSTNGRRPAKHNTRGGRGSPTPSSPDSSIGSSSVSSSSIGSRSEPGRRANFNPTATFNPTHSRPDTRVEVGNNEKQRDSKSLEKFRQVFKCPRFSGNTKDWKTWDKGFKRYLAIWDLDHVLDPEYFCEPLTERFVKENKLVFYLLEDAT